MRDIREFEPLWGEWRSVRLLGQGSYGKVYLAEKVELGKHYYSAIKYIPIPTDPNQTKELYSEGLVHDEATLQSYYEQVLRALMAEININYALKGNANIVSYEEHKVIPRTGEPGYDIFIKMELLTGLVDYIRAHPLTVADVVQLGCDICMALMALQREKIIHRDIKPANIFVHSSGHFKLGDFGVARTMEKTRSNLSAKGTFAFMAPEVARGGEGDYRVDIYSLGLVLYRLLNGNRSPFLPLPPAAVSYEANNQAHRRRLQGEPLPAPTLADAALAEIVLKACAFRPQDRYEDAAALCAALVHYRQSLSLEGANRVVLGALGDGHATGSRSDWLMREQMELFSAANLSPSATHGGEGHSTRGGATKGEAAPAPQPETPRPERNPEPVPPRPPEEGTVYLAQEPEPQEPTIFYQQDRAREATVLLTQETPEQNQSAPPPPKAPSYPPYQPPQPPKAKKKVPQKPASQPSGSAKPSPEGVKKSKLPLMLGAGGGVAVAAVAVFLLLGQGVNLAERSQPPETGDPAQTSRAEMSWFDLEDHASPSAQEIAVFQDAGLEAAVRNALGLTAESPLRTDMLDALQSVQAGTSSGVTVQSLSDLKQLPNLTTLDLSGQKLDSLAPLAELSRLTTLNLNGCTLSDPAELSLLPEGLEYLNLRGTGLNSLAFASKLTRLTHLDISSNQVTDLTPLAGLSQLVTLTADGNPVQDWTPVAHVTTVSGAPTATPTPTASAAPTTAPTATPKPTAKPTAKPTPKPTAKPTAKPAAPPKPAATPKPAPTPTPAPKPTPKPTPSTIAVSSVSISRSSALLDVGGSMTLSATVNPSNATNRSVTWSSSNPSVATVSSSGQVRAIKPGTAVITASCAGHSASCTVSVS